LPAVDPSPGDQVQRGVERGDIDEAEEGR
jgi:hypothetical protein